MNVVAENGGMGARHRECEGNEEQKDEDGEEEMAVQQQQPQPHANNNNPNPQPQKSSQSPPTNSKSNSQQEQKDDGVNGDEVVAQQQHQQQPPPANNNNLNSQQQQQPPDPFRLYFFSTVKSPDRYYSAFVANEYNDFETLMAFDNTTEHILINDCQMNKIHAKRLINSIQLLKEENTQFREWLRMNITVSEYQHDYQHFYRKFMNGGIVTLDMMQARFERVEELVAFIGGRGGDDNDEYQADGQRIWQAMPKNVREKRKNKKNINSNSNDNMNGNQIQDTADGEGMDEGRDEEEGEQEAEYNETSFV